MLKPQTLEEIDRVAQPRRSLPLSGQNIIAALLGGLVVGAFWLATAFPAPKASAPSTNIHSNLGDLKVDFMIQTSPGSAEGSTLEEISDIEFLPNYVVLKGRNGSGHVFAADRIRKLNWSR